MSSRLLAPSLAFAAAACLALPARAAGPYDGTWVVDVPAAGIITGTTEDRCPALRLPVRIRDNQVTGRLERIDSATGTVVVAGSGNPSAPVHGTVAPDGTVHAQWQNYQAVGRLGTQMGQITIDGACGPRDATAVRVREAPSATSSMPPER